MYQNKTKNAFTILELAVVIVIIAILIFTTINYSNTMSVNAKNRITKDKLKIIYLALGQYLTNNKKLPCPIPLNVVKNKVMSQDLSPPTCTNGCQSDRCYGGVPARDLGLSAELSEDGFGNKIFYMVKKDYTIINNFGNYTSSTRNSNNFTIQEQINGTNRQITDKAIVVLSSSGANQFYAYRSKNHFDDCGAVPNCNYISTTSSNTSDSEQINSIIVSSNTYPSTIFINDYTSPIFDDLVLYKTEEDFSLDFNQFYLQKCSANTINECGDLSYNLQKSQPTKDGNGNNLASLPCPSDSNISRRVKCYQSNNCRFLFDCRK